MISITMLFFKHYKTIFLLISIIPIIFLIYGMCKFSLKKIIISIAIIIALLIAFVYLTKREPSSKYAAKTVVHLDEKLKQYDNLLKNYDGLNSDLYTAANKVKEEIKELQDSLDLTKEEKERVEKHLEENENKIKEIKEKCKYIEQNICILNNQLIDLEKKEKTDAELAIEFYEIKEQLAKEKDKVKSQIPISQTRFDEIKNYILSLDDNLLPSNLNPNEKTKIEEIKTPIKSTIQESQLRINGYEKIIVEIQDKLKNINNLNNELQFKKGITKEYNEKIQRKKDEFPTAPDAETRQQLQKELNQLQNERTEIIQRIIYIQREIEDEDKKQYGNILKSVEKTKQQLDKEFETLKSNNEKTIIDELKKIYQITN
ncbi:hypothetical protein [Candidatus Phytoplasma sp. AldY-WA1]|uniref:hypothetical protein n=1 Tax=Candidatus Phytoplasma sp. AldY-WA1 TaxID=2852100 RepID=UPI00254B0498|nr:hypothetical protein [Candidatus Phytoplasma sp. AldY-WA1]